MGGLLVRWGSATSSSSSAGREDGVRLKEALGATGSKDDRTTGAGVGVELVDQDTDAPPPPCLITSLVGGKGAGAETGVGAAAGVGAGIVFGAGATAAAGARASAAGAGGPATAAPADDEVILTELSSTFTGLAALVSSKQELATNSSAKSKR